MKEVLVVANRTLGGAKLLEAVRSALDPGDVRFRLVVPQSNPSAGLVIYDEAVRESAQVRVDLALSAVAAEGMEASGEVGDADPFLATMDAIAQHRPDEIIVSTHPAMHSGWLRRDLIERIRNASGLPVEHVVVDLEQEGLPFKVTLVLANKTSSGEELLEHLKAKAAEEERAPVHRGRSSARWQRPCATRGPRTAGDDARPPQRGGLLSSGHDRRSRPLYGGGQRARAVPGRRRRHLDAARPALGLDALEPDRARPQRHLRQGRARGRRLPDGPDPRDGRLRARWRPRASPTRRPRRSRHGAGEHHGPPAANRSSRVEPQLLGMLLFIISEIMVFGAFFTAYFFIRVAQGDPWPATRHHAPGRGRRASTRRSSSPPRSRSTGPSSAIKKGNRFGLKAGMLTTFLLGCTFLFIQINEYANIGFAPQDARPADDLLLADGPARRTRLHRAAAAAVRHDPSLPRPLQPRGTPRRRGARHLLALRRHHVDRRLHDRLHPLTAVGTARLGVLRQLACAPNGVCAKARFAPCVLDPLDPRPSVP